MVPAIPITTKHSTGIMLQTDEIPIVNLPDVEQTGKGAFEALKGLSFDDAIAKIANGIVDFSFHLLLAILVFYVGKLIINRLYKIVRNVMIRRDVDASLTTFVLSLVKMTTYFILIIIVIGLLGVETSSFIALFASAGVAIGMALSGTLQNFAGGVLILLLKPYKVGNYIEAQGYAGTVKAINIFNTVINTPDNKCIIIPNGGLSTSSVNNYSMENYRRVDWTISLSYNTDFDNAKDAIVEILKSDSRVVRQYLEDDIVARREKTLIDDRSRLQELSTHDGDKSEIAALKEKIANEVSEVDGETDADVDGSVISPAPKLSWWGKMRQRSKRKQNELQAEIAKRIRIKNGTPLKIDRSPFVGLNEMGDSSINLVVRAWTPTMHYWDLYYDMNHRFFTELPKKGFEFPFPQLDVHFDSPVGN